LGSFDMSKPPQESPANLPDRAQGLNAASGSRPQLSTDHFALKLGLFYGAYFLFGGILLPFFPLWLESRGLGAREIGLVIAVPTLARIFATPVIAHQADRHGALRAALVIASIVGALAMVVVGLVEGFVAILVVYTVAAMAFSPLLSLSDAYAVSGLTARGRAYGPVRLWGSVTFIVGNVGAGLLLDFIIPGQLIWLIVAALAVNVAAALALAPVEVAGPARLATRGAARQLWRNPAFLAVVATIALVQPSHTLYYAFSTVAWRGAGFDGLTIGILWGVGVAAEIVLFAFSARLPPALGPTVMLAIGAAGATTRWAAMAFDPPLALLPLLQCLHAASFGATHLGAMAFLARAVPKELAATAQGTIATTSGIIAAVATGLSGLAYAASGSLAYLMMAAMACAGLACALGAHRLWRDR
jgi:PPP family 3-phenylpropionic acid transporter